MRNCILILVFALFALIQPAHSLSQSIIRACNVCHGERGISSKLKYPNLAGQHPCYFIKQLEDMKQHRLHCPSKMAAQLDSLSEKDIQDLAAYYAKLPRQKGNRQIAVDLLGKQIYTLGNYKKRIPACIICHGPRGKGNAQAGFPMLAGQSKPYIIEELHAFKRGRRNNDLNQLMQSICKQMSRDEIRAVANYIERF